MIIDILNEQYHYPEVEKIIKGALDFNKEGSVLLIVGPPGSGKSVFMNQLFRKFSNHECCMTAIRLEFLKKSDSPIKIYQEFLKVKSKDKPKILLLDSLDVLAYSRRTELQEWLYYIDKLKAIKGLSIICAARNFESEHLYPMNEQKWSKKISIKPLPEEFIKKILNKLNYNYSSLSKNFIDLIRIPLHLKICADIIQIDEKIDFKDASNLHSLYAKLFETTNMSTKDLSILIELADEMVSKRTTKLICTPTNIKLIEEFRKIERSIAANILIIDDENKTISFFHQTLIDYFAALKFIQENKSLTDFLIEHNQSLFIRPVLRHILSFLRMENKIKLFMDLYDIFLNSDKINFHVKTAILSDISSWERPSIDEGKFLVRLFRETKDSEKLLFIFLNNNENVNWYLKLKDPFIKPILSNNNDLDTRYRILLSFIEKISKKIPLEILELDEILLNKDKNKNSSLKILNIVKNISDKELDDHHVEKYIYFIEHLVRNEILINNYQIKEISEILLKKSPERSLKLFLEYLINKNNSGVQIRDANIITESFNNLVPEIFSLIPYKTLIELTDFFEKIISKDYTSKEISLPDWPFELLFSAHEERFDFFKSYNWYKNVTIDFCKKYSSYSKHIIKELENSNWETQKQLSFLCKINNLEYYKSDILKYIFRVLDNIQSRKNIYIQSELFIEVISKSFPFLSEKEKESIIDNILNLKLEDRNNVRIWKWEPLNCILKTYRKKSLRKKIEELRNKYKFEKEYKHIPPISSSGVQSAKSPFTAKYLSSLKLDELYDLLVSNRSIEERWDFDNDIFYGGIIELAREVAVVLVKNLNKYKQLIENLANDPGNDEYLSWFFSEIKIENIKKDIINWLISIIHKLYKREYLQLEVTRLLRKLSSNLTPKNYKDIKAILKYLSNSNDPIEDKYIEYQKQGYANNALSEGINSVRGLLAELIIILLGKFKDGFLNDILQKLTKDRTISVRSVILNYLPYAIKPLGWEDCLSIFLNTFSEGNDEYEGLASKFIRYVPEDKISTVLDFVKQLEEKKDTKLGKDYAVITTIFYLRNLFSEKRLIEILIDKSLYEEGLKDSIHILISNAKIDSYTDKCLKIIEYLLKKDLIKHDLGFLFENMKPENFHKLIPIINDIIDKDEILHGSLFYLLKYLEKSLLYTPLEVFNILRVLISKISWEFFDITKHIPADSSKAPINILNTIFECYPEKENEALEILDKLIEFNWNGIDDYLDAFDRI